MLISTCLCDCAVNKEQGVKVYINKKRGEKVLLFRIDNATFRQFVYGSQRVNICDLLIYYRGINAEKDIFCFTELKKELDIVTLKKAVNQLIQAKKGFEVKLTEEPNLIKLFPNITWLAYICYKNMPFPLPVDFKSQKSELKKVFDDCRIQKEKNIGNFLRDISRQNSDGN